MSAKTDDLEAVRLSGRTSTFPSEDREQMSLGVKNSAWRRPLRN